MSASPARIGAINSGPPSARIDSPDEENDGVGALVERQPIAALLILAVSAVRLVHWTRHGARPLAVRRAYDVGPEPHQARSTATEHPQVRSIVHCVFPRKWLAVRCLGDH